ncbi:MAG: hypothetical protein ABI723_04205 [Bacteroidia bacterium]
MKEQEQMTNLQIELMKVFRYELDEKQLLEIRAMLANYFADKLTEEMDKVWKEKGWTDETIKQFSQEHMRTPYKRND